MVGMRGMQDTPDTQTTDLPKEGNARPSLGELIRTLRLLKFLIRAPDKVWESTIFHGQEVELN